MKKLIIYLLANLINFGIWFEILISTTKKIYEVFLFLTILSFTFSIFYLLIMLIYEIRLHLNKHDPDKYKSVADCKFYNLVRDRIFKFVFMMNLTVCTGYWSLLLGGDSVMSFNFHIFLNVYLHFIIGVQIVLELLLTERRFKKDLFIYDYVIGLLIFTFYSFFLIYIAKIHEMFIYPFLRLEVSQIIGVNLILILISFNVYQLSHFIVEKKQRRIVNADEENNRSALLNSNETFCNTTT